MAIYFVGGERGDFLEPGVGAVTFSALAASFCRAAVDLDYNSNPATFPPGRRIETPQFTALSDLWVTFLCIFGGAGSGLNAGNIWFYFYDGGTIRLGVRAGASSSQIEVFKRDASGTVTVLATFSYDLMHLTSFATKVDCHIVYGASGSVTMYMDGAQIGTYSGNVVTDSATTLDQLGIGALGRTRVSEVIIADENTRSMRLANITSSTAGAAQAWTGTASVVNKTDWNDATYIYAASAGLVQQYQPAALPAGTWTVKAVVLSTRSLKGAGGPQNMQGVVRVSGTDYTPLASFSLGTSFDLRLCIYPQNPATAAAWTQSQLAPASFQYGLKSVA